MNYEHFFNKLPCQKVINLAKRNKRLSHAYIFSCEDLTFLKEYLQFLAVQFLTYEDTMSTTEVEPLVKSKSHPDLMEFPSEIGGKVTVKDIESIVERTNKKPLLGKNKVFILSDLSVVNEQAQNKLLKILEEPCPNTYFLLGAQNSSVALQTIKSRSVNLTINEFLEEEVFEFIKDEPKSEDVKKLVAQSANGNLTKAIALLKDDNFEKNFDLSLNILRTLKSTADMAEVSKMYDKVDFFDMAKNFQLIFRDMLMIKTGQNHLVCSKFKMRELNLLSSSYEMTTLIESVELITQFLMKKNFNLNKTSLVDSLNLQLLEVKYSCQL